MWVPFFAAKYHDTEIEQYYYCSSLPRTDMQRQKRSRQCTPSPHQHTPSPQLAANVSQSSRSPPALLSESNIRTTHGASSSLDLTDCPKQTRKDWCARLFASSPSSSHWSNNSASPVAISHSTPTRQRDQSSSFMPSLDSEPTIYQHPDASIRSELQENEEVILGVSWQRFGRLRLRRIDADNIIDNILSLSSLQT